MFASLWRLQAIGTSRGRHLLLVSANAIVDCGLALGLSGVCVSFFPVAGIWAAFAIIAHVSPVLLAPLCSRLPYTPVPLSEAGMSRAVLHHLEGRSPVPEMRNRRLRGGTRVLWVLTRRRASMVWKDLGTKMYIDLFRTARPNWCGSWKMPSGCEFGAVGSQRGGGCGRYSLPFLPQTCLLGGLEGQGLRAPPFGLPLLPCLGCKQVRFRVLQIFWLKSQLSRTDFSIGGQTSALSGLQSRRSIFYQSPPFAQIDTSKFWLKQKKNWYTRKDLRPSVSFLLSKSSFMKWIYLTDVSLDGDTVAFSKAGGSPVC